MNRAIIVHGKPTVDEYHDKFQDSQSNCHWLPWLQQQFCAHDILAQTPEMPEPYQPNYEKWKNEFERLLPDKDTLLVGHSCGGGFIVRWLSENPDKMVAKVVLVAPWLDIEGNYPEMFNFTPRGDINGQSVQGIHLLVSTDDYQPMQLTKDHLINTVLGIKYHEFNGYKHFTYSSMKTHEFPELVAICLGE